ncbi:DeoR/GlpR transcriptional regulator [Testudinibacter sp. TR-2022]|uniref:DeoR/GlpR family DNA-binding transcription regulator n=1 Tax=Testudinibacter sp. TR-2022 TaxID=2585029 RepID=UPI00111A6D3B|nr:DeoR/GlpR family DNA-binding transcription regulator [Testudinibacter sp. TR-2022]TNH03755.1 DeoR/GlpR transcriptional regulator [Pasteurellaceae bacterium Phil31]TNH11698.1 DeoR/GlpR transcriptional regulator [Testudinibacter sp. TR-2022]TNH12068.1 DeoR/GlpR transcriptional regulator [Testudinibacter sp. TR-2022]TNH15511.1 DeoR/GlpR transcriptional regulator [Testudinibacter sp. TR-2022]TNH15655.1 DeoR/GlpR transcriptional regulator [Testudinibacter sp. TR-2022]
MIPAERQKRILMLLSEHDLISIAELVEIMQVSHMTVRRDIQKLEEQGKVVSVSGGVQLLQRLFSEPTHDDKSLLFQSQKQAIGATAAQLIANSKTVYLDAGTTTLEIAHHIAKRSDLLVITNDFVIANFLIKEGSGELIHTGGYVCKDNYSSVGELSAQFLRNISIDVAFVSTSSWNLKGLTTPDEKKLAVKRAIVESSKKNVLVTDSSKYGKVATFWIYGLDVFDTIVTDKDLLESVQKNIQNLNIELMLA